MIRFAVLYNLKVVLCVLILKVLCLPRIPVDQENTSVRILQVCGASQSESHTRRFTCVLWGWRRGVLHTCKPEHCQVTTSPPKTQLDEEQFCIAGEIECRWYGTVKVRYHQGITQMFRRSSHQTLSPTARCRSRRKVHRRDLEESITFTTTHANPVGQQMTLPLANVSIADTQPKCVHRLFDLFIH